MQICECGNSDPSEFEYIYSGGNELYHQEYTLQLMFWGASIKAEKTVKAICCKKCGLVVNSRIVENIVLQRGDLVRFFRRCNDSPEIIERLHALLKVQSNFKRFNGMSLRDARGIILEEFDGRDKNVGRRNRNRNR